MLRRHARTPKTAGGNPDRPGKDRPHREPVADPMAVRGSLDERKSLHDGIPPGMDTAPVAAPRVAGKMCKVYAGE